MRRNHPKGRRRAAALLGVVLALALGALMLAGCGGSSGGESSTTASSGASPEGAAGKGGGMFEVSEEAKACLKEKGVELPEFKAGEGGEPPQGEPPQREGGEKFEEQQKAFEECGVETPKFKGAPGGRGGAPNMNSAAFKKQVKEYAACVRENGYELAEPNFSGEGPVFEKSESESAAFKQASAKCRSLLGGPQGSRSG